MKSKHSNSGNQQRSWKWKLACGLTLLAVLVCAGYAFRAHQTPDTDIIIRIPAVKVPAETVFWTALDSLLWPASPVLRTLMDLGPQRAVSQWWNTYRTTGVGPYPWIL